MGNGFQGGGAVGIVYDYLNPLQPEKDLPPGLRRRVVTFLFRPKVEFENGEVVPINFTGGSFSLRGAKTQPVDAFIPGEIRFGSSRLAPVDDLEAVVGPGAGNKRGAGAEGPEPSGAVLLSWTNSEAYDAIRIERNGRTIAELPGSRTGHIDPAPAGVYTYKVIGLAGDATSFPRSLFLSTSRPRGVFLRGDGNHDGRVDVTDPIGTLEFLFRGGPAPRCEDAADANDDGRLDLSDPLITLAFLFTGDAVLRAPGTRYPWFDPTPDLLMCAGARNR